MDERPALRSWGACIAVVVALASTAAVGAAYARLEELRRGHEQQLDRVKAEAREREQRLEEQVERARTEPRQELERLLVSERERLKAESTNEVERRLDEGRKSLEARVARREPRPLWDRFTEQELEARVDRLVAGLEVEVRAHRRDAAIECLGELEYTLGRHASFTTAKAMAARERWRVALEDYTTLRQLVRLGTSIGLGNRLLLDLADASEARDLGEVARLLEQIEATASKITAHEIPEAKHSAGELLAKAQRIASEARAARASGR